MKIRNLRQMFAKNRNDSKGFERSAETVADPGLGHDKLRMFWIRLDFFAKTFDESSQVIDLVAVVWSPHRLQQLPMRDRFIGMLCKVSQQIQFLRSQVGTRRPARHCSRGKVDRELADAQATGRGLCNRDAAERRSY